MKKSKRNKLLGLALTGSFSLFGASSAFAAANDDIGNRATLLYEVGGALQTEIESASGTGNSTPGANQGADTVFKEDRVINFTVTQEAGASTSVAPGSTDTTANAVPFVIQNLGNAPQGFLLKGVHNLAGSDPYTTGIDIFTPTNIRTYVDVNDDGNYVLADDGAVEFVTTVAAGAQVRVFVIADIPTTRTDATGIQNDDLAVVSLVAQVSDDGTTGIAADAILEDDNGNISPGGTFSAAGAVGSGTAVTNADNPATMETVFNDPAGTEDGTGTAPGSVKNGQSADASSYIIATAVLTVTKSTPAPPNSTLWDPINNAVSPKSIPGAYVTYTITIANTGAADADLTTLTDTLAAALELDPDFITNAGPGNATSAAGDSFRLIHSAGGVGSTQFCTGVVDAPTPDGCSYIGKDISIDINAVMGGAPFATLTTGQSLTIEFNVIVQ
jgi:uncharacterized repeat protein (TIGR01451 family)